MLNYLSTTLGIKSDNISDDEIIPDEAGNKDQGSDDSEKSPNLGTANSACLSRP